MTRAKGASFRQKEAAIASQREWRRPRKPHCPTRRRPPAMITGKLGLKALGRRQSTLAALALARRR